MLPARTARTLATALATALVAMAPVATTAGTAPASAAVAAEAFDPTDWRTLPDVDLPATGGWDFVSMMDHRWKYDRLRGGRSPIWQCSCTQTSLANLLDWEFPLEGGGAAETVPHAPTPVHVWFDPRGPWVDQELLWSPTYVDAWLDDRAGYRDRDSCGAYAHPWALATAGAAVSVDVGGTWVSAPTGITWTAYNTFPKGLTDDVKDVIARELHAGKLVVVMRAAPRKAKPWTSDEDFGGHGNLVVGFDGGSDRFLAIDPGWPRRSTASHGAPRAKYGENYQEWEESIQEVFVYDLAHGPSGYSALLSEPTSSSGLRAAGAADTTADAAADYRLSAVGPDGQLVGWDPDAGTYRVHRGSFATRGVVPGAAVEDGATTDGGGVQRLPEALYAKAPQAGRWRYTVHGASGGAFDLRLQDGGTGALVERARLTGTVTAGGERRYEAVRAADGTTTVTEVAQFTPEPVVELPRSAWSDTPVRLDGTRSYDADGSVVRHEWDLGDGTRLEGPSVTHRYDAPGTYAVTLTVTDDAGATRTVERTVQVAPVDTRAPVTTVAPVDGPAWRQQPFDVAVTATDQGRGVRTLTARAEGASAGEPRTSAGEPITVRVAEEGRTTVVAEAVDRDGNRSGEQRLLAGVDTTAPSSAVMTPLAGGRVAALGMVAGSATDATSGAAEVELSLTRASDGLRWDGTAWGDGDPWLRAALGSPGADRWYLLDRLPRGADLPHGDYVLRSRATDRAGNREAPGAGVTVTVTESLLPAQPEPERLAAAEFESLGIEAVDDDGTVVGTTNAARRALVWAPDGTRRELPPLPGHTASAATDVLDGVVVGTSSGTGASRAVVWRDGAPVDLGLLDGAASSAALAVDGSGTAWGTVRFADGRETAVRFGPDGPEPLAGLGGPRTDLRDVSASGRYAVGLAQDAAGTWWPVRWTDGVAERLPQLDGSSVPRAVNDRGETTGTGSAGGDGYVHALAWTAAGQVVELGPGGGQDVDERGVVVGTSGLVGDTGGRLHAAAWQDGGLLRLSDVLPAGSPWALTGASGVSPTTGVVAGSGREGASPGYYRLRVPRLVEEPDPDADVTAPEVAAAPADGAWRREPVTFAVTATDAGSGVAAVQTSLGGEVAGARAEVRVEDEGVTTVAYAARDVAGNTAAPRTVQVRLDRTAPDVRLPLPVGEEWSREPVAVPVTGDDALSGLASLHHRLDGGEEVVVTDPGTVVPVSGDGEHVLTAWAVDRAGNRSAPVEQVVRVDRTAPRVAVGPAADGAVVPRGQLLAVVADDAASGLAGLEVRHLVDGVLVGEGAEAVALTRPGEHRVEVTATDRAGNTTERVVTVTVAEEPGPVAAPGGGLVADAGGPYRAAVGEPVVLDGSGSTGGAALSWGLPAVEQPVEGATATFVPPAAGRWLVELTAAEGGRRATDVTVVEAVEAAAVTADAGADVALDEGGQAVLQGTVSAGATAAWEVVAADGTSGTCAVGSPGAATTTVTCDDEGTWTATLTATDGAATATDEAVVTVANAAPTVVLGAPVTAVLGEPVTVTAVPGDAGARDELTCRLDWADGTVVEGCTSTRSFAEVGEQGVRVEVSDGDGGTASAAAAVAVVYDVALPEGGRVNAGRAIPVRFGLGGDHGLDVLVEAVSVRLDAQGRPVGEEVPAFTPGASHLTYAPGADRYHWDWDTERSWAGQTRALVLRLDDGSEHRVVYRFR